MAKAWMQRKIFTLLHCNGFVLLINKKEKKKKRIASLFLFYLPAIENVTMKTELKSVIAVPAWPVSSRKSPNIIPNDEVGPKVVIWRKK